MCVYFIALEEKIAEIMKKGYSSSLRIPGCYMTLFLHKSKSTLQKGSAGETEARREEANECRLPSRLVADPGTKADLLSPSSVVALFLVRLPLHNLKKVLKLIKKPGMAYTAKRIFFLSVCQ